MAIADLMDIFQNMNASFLAKQLDLARWKTQNRELIFETGNQVKLSVLREIKEALPENPGENCNSSMAAIIVLTDRVGHEGESNAARDLFMAVVNAFNTGGGLRIRILCNNVGVYIYESNPIPPRLRTTDSVPGPGTSFVGKAPGPCGV